MDNIQDNKSLLVRIKDVHRSYQTDEVVTHVLRGITFTIQKGEFLSIMGPSGSGKSTLMHILGLLDRVSSGTYELEGRDVTKLTDDELAYLRNAKIGFVFQAFNLLPRTTVLENVKLPLVYARDSTARDADRRAREVLESVGLGHRLQYYTNQISGGEKQRVAIARANALALADQNNVPHMVDATAFARGAGTATWQSNAYDTDFVGTMANYTAVEGGEVAAGRFFLKMRSAIRRVWRFWAHSCPMSFLASLTRSDSASN